MTPNYLDALDKLLLFGVSRLSASFTEKQTSFVVQRQLPEGGFLGQMGGADLYYTDFGIRLVRLLSDDCSSVEETARWMGGAPQVTSVLDCFSLLNAARLLGEMGYKVSIDKAVIRKTIMSQQSVDSCFCRIGNKVISGYNTFIAGLCFEMLGTSFPNIQKALAAVRALRQPDGGYCETPGQPLSQTNSTAAAVAFLTMHDALEPESAEAAAHFLAAMQTGEGGFLAHPQAPEADLLSTFTGVLTLFGLNAMDRIDLPSIARFVGALAQPSSGFAGCLGGGTPDVEYTYYGVGTLALLQAYVAAVQAG